MTPGRDRYSGSLFERIRRAGDSVIHNASAKAFRQSICNNLQNILNTRYGSCQGTPELGIIDFNDAASSITDFATAISGAIRDCILRYEPRVKQVTVSTAARQNTSLDLHFHLTVWVSLNGISDVLEFDLSMDNHQYFRMN